MAHLSDTMAYTGQTPWHGLGNVLPPQQSLDIWLQAAGMDWTIEQSDVMFNVASDALHVRPYSDSKVLYRSDTLTPLSVVSSRYNVVQPHEVLHFYQIWWKLVALNWRQQARSKAAASCGHWLKPVRI